jgi:Zn-finger nucleic acid-binding protein
MLETAIVADSLVERCERCGGEYCRHAALRALLSKHVRSDDRSSTYRRPSPLVDAVRYRKCPECAEMMSRRNFQQTSGVIVDVCAAHGIWFDRGELSTIIEFVASGAAGLAEAHATVRDREVRRLEVQEGMLRGTGPR